MRDHPERVMLALDGGRWSVLVGALQSSRAKCEDLHRVAFERGDEFGAALQAEMVRDFDALLAVIDPVGERQNVEFSERLMKRLRD